MPKRNIHWQKYLISWYTIPIDLNWFTCSEFWISILCFTFLGTAIYFIVKGCWLDLICSQLTFFFQNFWFNIVAYCTEWYQRATAEICTVQSIEFLLVNWGTKLCVHNVQSLIIAEAKNRIYISFAGCLSMIHIFVRPISGFGDDA